MAKKKYEIRKEVGPRGTFWYAYGESGECILSTGTGEGKKACKAKLLQEKTKTVTVEEIVEI